MKASAFVSTFKPRGFAAWEAAAVDLCSKGSFVAWPLMPVTFSGVGGHSCIIRVASDYLAIGEPDDYLRLPLTPGPAQRIADMFGMLLPTKLMVTELWRQARTKPTPQPVVPNKGGDLDQYVAEDALIEKQLAALGRRGLIGGHKKDVVIGKLVRPGKVVIWGWFWPDDPNIHGPYLTDNLRASQPIQPYSDAHGDFYVDYSHGIRLVDGTCLLDGQPRLTADVLLDKDLAPLISDEGALTPSQLRYATSGPKLVAAVPYQLGATVRTDPADRGLDLARERVLEQNVKGS